MEKEKVKAFIISLFAYAMAQLMDLHNGLKYSSRWI